MKKTFLIISLYLGITSATAFADVWEIGFRGIQFPTYPNRNGVVRTLPQGAISRAMNADTSMIFSPGIDITYDYRKTTKTPGPTPIVSYGLYQDPTDHTIAYFSAGGRYQDKLFIDSLFWAISGEAGISYEYAIDYRTPGNGDPLFAVQPCHVTVPAAFKGSIGAYVGTCPVALNYKTQFDILGILSFWPNLFNTIITDSDIYNPTNVSELYLSVAF